MLGDLGRLGVGGVPDRQGQGTVCRRVLAGNEAALHRFGEQRVLELDRTFGTTEQPTDLQVAQLGSQLLRRQAGRGGQQLGAQWPRGDAEQPQYGPGLLDNACQPAVEQVGEEVGQAGSVVEMRCELLGEEGLPLAARVDGVQSFGPGSQHPELLGSLLPGERAEREHRRARQASHASEPLLARRGSGLVAGAPRADDGHRTTAEQVLHQVEGGRVGPVEVLHEKGCGAVGRQGPDNRVDGSEQQLAVVDPNLDVAGPGRGLGDQHSQGSCNVRRARGEGTVEPVRVCVDDIAKDVRDR